MKSISIHAPRVGCDTIRRVYRFLKPDFNPRTPCGVRRGQAGAGKADQHISIHAPRVGCDTVAGYVFGRYRNFNPRTPCGVRRTDSLPVSGQQIFQSTHPVWGATWTDSLPVSGQQIFQSTHPVWGATSPVSAPSNLIIISIHAPRVGCDLCESKSSVLLSVNFNPRTPCGVRLFL